MLYESFKEIRKLIENNLPEIKTTQWFNSQYDGTIYTTPVCFVEFPGRIPLEQVAGSEFRGEFGVRLHIVSGTRAGQDGSIIDDVIAEHERIAESALKLLEGRQIYMGKGQTTSLLPSGWQHYHGHKGFLITFVEFKGTGYGL